VALSSDTGNFSYGNTSPGVLRLTADMLEQGLDIASLREKLENNWSESRLRLWGRLMQNALLLDEGRLAAVLVTRRILSDCGATREDSEGFVEQLRRLKAREGDYFPVFAQVWKPLEERYIACFDLEHGEALRVDTGTTF